MGRSWRARFFTVGGILLRCRGVLTQTANKVVFA